MRRARPSTEPLSMSTTWYRSGGQSSSRRLSSQASVMAPPS
jgi:hypothetical protein